MTNQWPISFWTQARIDELKARFFNGETYGEIWRAIGAASRNAVIGKAHRIGLFRAMQPVRRENGHRIARHVNHGNIAIRAKAKPMSEDEPPVAFANPVSIFELRHNHCRWPGPAIDGPALSYCGNAIVPGQSYCLTHCRIAYAKPQRR